MDSQKSCTLLKKILKNVVPFSNTLMILGPLIGEIFQNLFWKIIVTMETVDLHSTFLPGSQNFD